MNWSGGGIGRRSPWILSRGLRPQIIGSNPVLTTIKKKTHMREIIEILKTLPNVITSVSGTIESITISYDTNGEAKVEIKFYNKS